MNTRLKTLTRCTSLLVALGILLGLTVTSCSHHDHDGGRGIRTTEVNYIFEIMSGTAKADLNATKVILSAFDVAGNEVFVDQPHENIADHTNITEEGAVGGTYYEGYAHIDNAATKLVLSYYDAKGNEVGKPDVLDNIKITDGFIFDFTAATPEPTADVTWDPAGDAQTIKVGESKTIAAKAGNVDYNVTLTIADAETRVTVAGAELTGVEATAEGDTVEVTATATDAEGNEVDSRTYNFTVIDETPAPAEGWTPADPTFTLPVGVKKDITYYDAEGTLMLVTLGGDEASSGKFSVDYDDETGITSLTGLEVGENYTVYANAKDESGTTVDKITYHVTFTTE